MASENELYALNAQARAAVQQNSLPMVQQIASQSVSPATQNILNIAPRNVGLIKGFLVEVNGTLVNTGASVANRTQFGAANALSRVQFNDLNNYTRHNVSGLFLAMMQTAKNGYGFGGAYAPNLPSNFGSNWTVQSLAATIAASGGTAPLRQIYYVPISYSADDYRGAIFANVVNATMNLQLVINTTPGFTTGPQVDAIAGGSGTAVAWQGNVTVTVYQIYDDQLPVASNGQVIVPTVDLSTMYLLNDTTMTGLAVGQDFTVPYANLRSFLATYALYANGNDLNVGTDLNYWALRSANFTEVFRYTPQIAALFARQSIMSDFPAGLYYFDHRRKPISTLNFGNMELVANPSVVNANASLRVAYEQFALQNAITVAGSLPNS